MSLGVALVCSVCLVVWVCCFAACGLFVLIALWWLVSRGCLQVGIWYVRCWWLVWACSRVLFGLSSWLLRLVVVVDVGYLHFNFTYYISLLIVWF